MVNKFEEDEARAQVIFCYLKLQLSKDKRSTLQSRYVLETMSLVV